MAEFDQLQQQLKEAREKRERSANKASAAKERLRQIEAELAEFDRVFDPRDPHHARERARIENRREGAAAELEKERAAFRRHGSQVRDAFKSFLSFTDPRDAVAKLHDATPLLLLPVRLETRFKTIPDRGGSRLQLWVRVYPDDCSIDTFEETLTESELRNAHTYWTSIWQAGGVEDQERAAWRGLVASHGSNRAAWIIKKFQPLNDAAAKPVKLHVSDVVLMIATEEPLTGAEETATANFWRAIWLADGAQAKENAAKTALRAALGDARAAQIIAEYQPANLAEQPQAGRTKNEVNVTTALLIFPKKEDITTKRSSWSRAPKAALLPDRFVFIGYATGRDPLVVLGAPIPSPLVAGPDPSADPADQLQQKDGELVIPDEMKWMVDFDRAVEDGMGFRIDLDPLHARGGFDRVLVVGIRISADAQTAKAELETLIQHHRFSRKGFGLLPQGTPTNNTEAAGSDFTRADDADASFDDVFKGAANFQETMDTLQKRDGQWLAECLGIGSEILKDVRNAAGVDQAEARAMQMALWSATLGYWMESMLNGVFEPKTVEQTRFFFQNLVSGRGMIPAVRIGNQPYGILPATAFSRITWIRQLGGTTGFFDDESANYLRRLYELLKKIDGIWSAMAQQVAHVQNGSKAGADEPDPHRTLLNILGLHPTSVEYAQRHGEDLTQLFNWLILLGIPRDVAVTIGSHLFQVGITLLHQLGYQGSKLPDLLQKFFFGNHGQLKGPLIDDRPLSETEPVRAYTPDGKNYLEWLINAANTSFETLQAESGFIGDEPPRALLYLLLRYAAQLNFDDASLRLGQEHGMFTSAAVSEARREALFIHIKEAATISESRYQRLYTTAPVITNSATVLLGDYIASSFATFDAAHRLQAQVTGLEILKKTPTARLERLFAEHIDCCSYRFDAWLQGMVHFQLAAMRGLFPRDDVFTQGHGGRRQGIYLGAYAWLEDLRPEAKTLAPVQIDEDLSAVFNKPGDPPLMRDSANGGYIHAPSLNQAVAAAVLRNGYISNATPENRKTMAVNLTSERVRRAVAMLEGIRSGQSLGALLGYQFERGLHDRHGLVEVDKFVYRIRKEFPLRANRLASTKEPDPKVSIEAIEARNVADGLSIVEHVKQARPEDKTYPFGKALPPATEAEKNAINAEIDRLLETHDAIADLALAEGVFQAVQGNYDRVAATLDAYSRGNFPPEPEVVRTPSSGVGLTHRVALHLEADVPPDPAAPPRAQAEPALNRWLATMLPPLDQVACKISFHTPSNATIAGQVTMRELTIEPIELLQLIRFDSEQAMSELDDRIVRRVIDTRKPRPDAGVTIEYMKTDGAKFSVFELMPLVASLRRLTQSSRPLRASDLALSTEGTTKLDVEISCNRNRVALPRNTMQTLRNDLAAFQTDLEKPILPNYDTSIQRTIELLSRAARFGVPQTGWGFTYESRQRQFRMVLKKVDELVTRWATRLAEFDTLLAQFAALPATATDEEKFTLLQRAERLISTVATSPLPASPSAFRTALQAKRALFNTRRAAFAAILTTTQTTFTGLSNDVKALLPVDAFDSTALTLEDEEQQTTLFASDALSVVKVTIAELDRRLDESQKLLDAHDTASELAAQVKALQDAAKILLGDELTLIPEFKLDTAQANEFGNALSLGQSDAFFDHLVNTQAIDFPIDDWLYGIARVREKMAAWERSVMFVDGFGGSEPQLTPVQLPFKPDDRWLALDIPPDYEIDSDRLLYTAHFATPFKKTGPQCGLLLDEWNEVIPASTATTGITFNYDRPNNEPPQTMLLVTPTAFRGAWQWVDIVDALNETLDLAKKRAVEPVHVEFHPYSRLLPATIMAVTMNELTISANLARNNAIFKIINQT